MNIIRVSMVPYVASEHGVLRTFDNTKLTALSTCPTWGIVRYEKHKTYKSGGRAMPLEAGKAAHEAYAAIRIADLWFNGFAFYPNLDVRAIATARANELFGVGRAAVILDVLSSGEDSERATMLAALEAFATSGFYEDPQDKRRTIANIEEALVAYVTRYPLGRTMAYIDERTDNDKRFVGIEIPVDMYLEIEYEVNAQRKVAKYRFTGRIDAIHWADIHKQQLSVEENKTASRLDDAWRLAFVVSHQPTGYCIAATALLGQSVSNGVVRGMSIPLPKSFDYGGIVNEPINRNAQHYIDWATTVIHVMEMTAPFLDTPESAPRFTHSCNRYFRSCPLIPFCDSPVEDRRMMLDEMETEEWSPLHQEDGNE